MNINFPVAKLHELNNKYENTFNFIITGASTINNPQNNTIVFLKRVNANILDEIKILKSCIIIVPERKKDLFQLYSDTNFIISSANPRLDYARILQFILLYTEKKILNEKICLAAAIGENFQIGDGTIVENNVVIGDNVRFGKGCMVKAGAVINRNVIVGDYTVIRENAVIGGYGFGFERDENGIPIRVPHIGGVIIGNNVEIGALTTVASGTIEPTIIEDDTKIDDHVHISHNCHIGKCCIITACVEISGSVKVGNNTWLGPHCSIINGISIGDNCLIGIGAVVNKSVKDDMIVSGNPAQSLESIKKERDLFKKLLMANDNG